jgi:hypothetical protein
MNSAELDHINTYSPISQVLEKVLYSMCSHKGKNDHSHLRRNLKKCLIVIDNRRKPSKLVKGEILMNGKRPDKYFKRLTAYVTQDDALPGFLTVRETLQFYADLKLPNTISREEKKVLFYFDKIKMKNLVTNLISSLLETC